MNSEGFDDARLDTLHVIPQPLCFYPEFAFGLKTL